LQQAAISYSDLCAVAVSQGSYTGLRIGVSAAKGLCFALGIPLLAIDT
jgi:tRNA threonylcarbamoyladenosine biosynthesis protein TsaB